MNRSSALRNKHGPATEEIVRLAPQSHAYGPTLRTFLGVDESVAGPPVWDVGRRLVGTGQVIMVRPLWHEMRQHASGEISLSGGTPSGVFDGIDCGHRLPGDSCPDDDVVATAIVHLYWHRRVIVLSADHARDRYGLRCLLEKDVAPVLNRDVGHGLSLLLLLKRRKTTLQDYAARVYAYVSETPFEPGFKRIGM